MCLSDRVISSITIKLIKTFGNLNGTQTILLTKIQFEILWILASTFPRKYDVKTYKNRSCNSMKLGRGNYFECEVVEEILSRSWVIFDMNFEFNTIR